MNDVKMLRCFLNSEVFVLGELTGTFLYVLDP